MNPLLFVLPIFAVYLVFRANMHRRAGKPRWFVHYLFMAGFICAIFLYELWMHLREAT